ncbi:hypothetical protein Hanom_Chr14g01255201 [Helianthus anomalus]
MLGEADEPDSDDEAPQSGDVDYQDNLSEHVAMETEGDGSSRATYRRGHLDPLMQGQKRLITRNRRLIQTGPIRELCAMLAAGCGGPADRGLTTLPPYDGSVTYPTPPLHHSTWIDPRHDHTMQEPVQQPEGGDQGSCSKVLSILGSS